MENKNIVKRNRLLTILFSLMLIGFGILLPAQAQQSEFVTVYPAPNDAYFTNPGIGWQRMEHNTPPLLSEAVVYPTREDVSWRVLNPALGSYNWSVLDEKIETASRNNQLFSFRVYTMQGESYGGHHVPDWVVNRDRGMIQNGAPNYANCTYQTYWAIFVDQLRRRYDGDARIAFIDISGYGNFNEWSWTANQTVWDDNYRAPQSLDGMARVRLADMFIGGSSTNHECQTSNGGTQTASYSYTGFQSTQLVMPYAGIQQSTRYVADRRDDVGIRYDCLGRAETRDSDPMLKIGDVIEATWRNAPIVFEFCAYSTTRDDVMARAEALINDAHAVIVHENLEEPRESAPLERLLTPVGYRYQLTQAVYEAQVNSGEALDLSMAWRNIGTAPAYPRMGYDFELVIYLLDETGQVIMQQPTSATVNDWMPADNLPGTAPTYNIGETLTVPEGLSAGDYQLRVAVVNVNNGQAINLALADGDASNRYLIGNVQVNGTAETEQPTQEPTQQPTNLPTEQPTLEPTLEPTAIPTDAPTEIPPAIASTDYLYLARVEAQAWAENSLTWATFIDITVQDQDGGSPNGATLIGTWEDGTPYTCTISWGWCGARLTGISADAETVMLTITNIEAPDLSYEPSANRASAVIAVAQDGSLVDVPEATEDDTPTEVSPTNTPIPTQVPPTSTPIPTQVPPTNTPIPTQIPPTNTPVPTRIPPTNTPIPTRIPPTSTPIPTRIPPTSTPIPAVNNSGYVYVADMDGQSWGEGRGTWATFVDISIYDHNNLPISGVQVTGRWHDGTTFSCISSGGWCGARLTGIPNGQQIATFTITGLSHTTLRYNANANRDPEAGQNNQNASNGTTISIDRRR